MFRKTEPTYIPPLPPVAPPSIEDRFNGASGDTAYATSIFTDAIGVLEEANEAYDDVEMRASSEIDDVERRASSEIDRLVRLRDEAARQRRKNLETIQNLQALIGTHPAE